VRYRGWVRAAVQHRYLTSSIFMAGFILSLGVFNSGWVKSVFFPEIQGVQVFIQAQLPVGTPFERSLQILDQMQEAQRQLIVEVNARAEQGDGTGELLEGWYTRARRDSVVAIFQLVPPEVRDLSATESAVRLRQLIGDIPDADAIEIGYTIGQNSTNVSYVLRHRDRDLLKAASTELKARLHDYDGAYFIRDDLQGQSDELHMTLLLGAEKLGLTLADVSRQVRQA